MLYAEQKQMKLLHKEDKNMERVIKLTNFLPTVG